ncbi:DUF1501 domain-containing protein [Marinobacter hydrocarbonoclasticus]|nr:DUF1501 domain-containing protein [Marinobacter nauticus]
MDRRELLKKLALGAGTLMMPGWSYSAPVSGDYKALVGVFLLGGNDAFNTVIPMGDMGFSEYQSIRSDMALERASLLTPGLTDQWGSPLGLHPRMQEISNLFSSGDAAVMVNSGTLMAPATKAQVSGRTVPLPEHLFSHNSQQDAVEAGTALTREQTGWGGRMMAMLGAGEGPLSPLYSTAGNRKWLRSSLGSNRLEAGSIPQLEALQSDERLQGYRDLVNQDDPSPFARELRSVMARALDNSTMLSDVLLNYPAQGAYPGGNNLAKQLKTVESLIQASAELGQGRQVFLVAMGGFDTHANLLSSHDRLMGQFSQAIGAFHDGLRTLGLSDQVTTFTMSDFGRRLTSNGSGTDHGWGGHQFVFGGAVKGGRYGIWPSLAPDSDDHYSLGRVIPTTAVDQVSATLCRWMGVGNSELYELFPNLSAFDAPTLDFMA